MVDVTTSFDSISAKMRLFTHNMLVCNVKACVDTAQLTTEGAKNFPLKIEVADGGVAQEESDFNEAFIARLIPKLDWNALRSTSAALGIANLPEKVPDNFADDEGFLQSVHTLVMDIHIKEGALVCPNCSRKYPIKNSIPNMLLRDDEVS